MLVKELIDILKMFDENVEVYIRTTENDFAQPLKMDLINITNAYIDPKYKNLEKEKIVFTAFRSTIFKD